MKRPSPKVLLACMPWAPYQEPSLGLSILSSCLDDSGLDNEVKHLNIYLLKYLKASSYRALADIIGINEFLFSYAFERDISANQLMALDQTISAILLNQTVIPFLKSRADYMDYLFEVRNVVIPKYLEFCLEKVLSSNCTLLGLTCMFDQTIASLALAKMVKENSPETTICLGGYALEGIVGEQIIRSFPFIDIIVQGDGEPSIEKLAEYSVGKEDISRIPNIIYVRDSDTEKSTSFSFEFSRNAKSEKNNKNISRTKKSKIILNNSPNPNYHHYFQDLNALSHTEKVTIAPSVLSVETSRGCWWGQKSHCIFCGIDSETLKYRQKDPDKVISMFDQLKDEFGEYTYRLSDYILPHTYYKTLLPTLSDKSPKMKLSCEMKANVNLEKFMLLKDSGFIQVQPGIESFSTNVLKKMAKGVSGIQNILTLKLGKQLGLKVDWNFLYGFPNDVILDYEPMLNLIPMLYHFDPPNSCDNVLVTRFAPLQTSPEKFGITKAQPHIAYETIFSEKFRSNHDFVLDKYCYIFQPNWENGQELETIYKLIASQITLWKKAEGIKPYLKHTVSDKGIVFEDGRFNQKNPIKNYFSKTHTMVYQAVHTKIESINKLQEIFNGVLSADEIKKALNDLIEARIVYSENKKYVGLSISG